jgi:uncharacterized protein (TIGR02300 family)
VAKPELGTKRLCAHCNTRFYDLNHTPITCPKCGAVFEAVQVASRGGRGEAARAAAREVEPVVAETPDAEFVSLEEADAEAQGKKKPGEAVEGEEDVEIDDDETLDDAAFIEESEEEDTDVTEIIGGDIENEEET